MKKIRLERTAPTTVPGYINANKQEVIAKEGPSDSRDGQSVYRLRCNVCRKEYGSNGIDNEKRLCPGCQNGVRGEPLREAAPGLFDGMS